MSIATLTFKFYDDSGLTTLTNTLFQLTHQSDFSDNPQNFNKFFGSNTSANKLQTQTSPGVNQIVLTPTRILTVWVLSTAYTLGQRRRPTVDNNYTYVVTTAGTSSATEPTWNTSLSGFTTDGTVVWQTISAEHPVSEIKLALTEAGLAAATGGASLNIGTTINGGVASAVSVWIQVNNSIATVGSTTGAPELGIYINAVQESLI